MAAANYDVIIIGSGPAGSTAAWKLSKAGKKVLVIDREHLPRYKPCGGGLSLEYLRQVFDFPFESVIDRRIDRIEYHYDGHRASIACRPDQMAMVMRDCFDKFILEQAACPVLQGMALRAVEEQDEMVVVRLEDGSQLTADYVIGADGANSIVRRQSGLHRKSQNITAIEAEVPYTPGLREKYSASPVFIFDKPKAGYAWIFPKQDFLSVGIGVSGHYPQLKQELLRIMAGYGISLEEVQLHGHPIPVYDPDATLATRRILLAGDAAGLADPFSGEGIRPAIKSGELAARAILAGDAEGYTGMVRETIGWRNQKSLFLWKIFIPLRGICLFLGAPNPYTTDAILELLADRHSSLYVAGWSFISMWFYYPLAVAGRVVGLIAGEDRRKEFLSRFLPAV